MRAHRTLAAEFSIFALIVALVGASLVAAPVLSHRAEAQVDRSITVTPADGLSDGESVSVGGVGWDVNTSVSFAQCKRVLTSPGDCESLPGGPATVDASGTFTHTVVVRSVIDLAGEPFYCAPADCQLLAVVTGTQDFQSSPIEFLLPPPPPPTPPDGVLTIGTIFPVTGFAESLSPAMTYGAELAVQDINDAGGVFGTDVALEQGDSGTSGGKANTEVDRLVALNADVIMGAAYSSVSETVIDRITGAGVIQFSPSNTSDVFTSYDDGGLYFRTSPSNLLQGRALADAVTGQGNDSASVLFRDDSYGQFNAEFFRESFESSGGTIDEFIPYAIDATNFDAEVDQLVAAGSDAVIVIGFYGPDPFGESAVILQTMHDRGIGPTSDTNVWGTDGNTNLDAVVADASILEGMRHTVHAVDPASIPNFINRLEAAMPDGATTAYGANTYDAVILVALAAEIAGTDDGVAIAAEINGVTKGGEPCTTFADCRAIIAAGGNPDYDGLGGPHWFFEAGEPSIASFRLETYGTDGRDAVLDEYVFADMSALAIGEVVQNVIEEIDAFLTNPDITKKAAKKLVKAQDKLYSALDELAETPPDVKKALENVSDAVKELGKAAREGVDVAAAIDQLIEIG